MINKDGKIAFFDSGVGGLTVFDKFKKLLPNESYVYFGDLKNSPYGAKTKSELIVLADKVFKFLETKNVKAVLMACNTTSANVYEELKNNYSFKVYPIIQSCAKVIAQSGVNSVGVFATCATINSHAYSKELKSHNSSLQVYEQACPKWVEIVEKGLQNSSESVQIIKQDLDLMLENKPEKIILGCTHYPYLINILSKFAPKDMFIDPSKFFAEFVKSDMQNLGLISENVSPSEEFYVSANNKEFVSAVSVFYDVKSLPIIADL